jgi:hypothetical protein
MSFSAGCKARTVLDVGFGTAKQAAEKALFGQNLLENIAQDF